MFFGCLLLVFLLATLLGTQVNRAIYSLAWDRRPISPWSRGRAAEVVATWRDRIPIAGWWFQRRWNSRFGPGFWIRPLLIEAFLAVGLTMLYWFELQQGLLPLGAIRQDAWTIHLQFASHALLIALMTVATFIDLDEKTIPDEVTLPGTLVALTWAAVFPASLLPAWNQLDPPIPIHPLLLTSPQSWIETLDGRFGLGLGLAVVFAWWYALLPKTLWYRGGPLRFLRYLLASILRDPATPRWTGLALLVAAAVTLRWWIGGMGWPTLLSALVGLGAAGALVWAVRIVASVALRQEAMGFGDVTLMAMIGAFLGWQPAILVFFLAPFTGVIVALLQWLLTGHREIAYGPFLCLAAVVVLVGWAAIWSDWGLTIFYLGGLLPAVITVCLGLLGVLLLLLQAIKSLWSSAR
jgi:prepilin signal peptidase PulO-like enzyme (type II secretory pathway)